MIKACFFDLDGTLLSHSTYEISESTRTALRMLQEKEIQVVLATGRHLIEIEEMPGNDICFDGYILLNGHLCLDKEKKVVYKHPICEEDCKKLAELFEKKEFPVTIIEKERQYNNFNNDYVIESLAQFSTPIPEISSYDGADVYMAVTYQAEKEMLQEYLPNCAFTQWHDYGYDVNAKGGGKTKGIQEYIAYHDLKREEIMAFGDAQNDIEMLQFAQIGVAMGNAADHVKKHADYVTKHVDEDGIYHALKHFGIIE